MKHPHTAPFPASLRRTALATAVSGLCLTPALSSLAAEPGLAPVGAEIPVNTLTSGNQTLPAIVLDANGDFVIAWQSYVSGTNGFDIRAQRFNAAGTAQGSEISVNAVTANTQGNPSIAIDADGDFVVAWQSTVGGDERVLARRFNAAGVAQGGEIAVNTTGTQRNPSVAIDADGDFVVVWQSYVSSGDDIRARRYNATGVAQGSEIAVNTVTAATQSNPAVALDAAGNFVVAWQSVVNSSAEIRAQRFSDVGIPLGSEIAVNTATTSAQAKPAIALDADGDFAVAWQSSATGNYEIRAQRFTAVGLFQGGEIAVNTVTTGDQRSPAIGMDADGDLIIAWTSTASGNTEIRAQRYDGAGIARGEEVAVNPVVGIRDNPAVALDADGDFVVAWQGFDVSSYEIRAQRFRGPANVDVSLFQTDSADPAPVGSPLTYTLSIGNLETPATVTGIDAIDSALGSATGLHIVDTLPAGSTAVSASGLNWSCTFPSGRVVCDYALPLAASDEISSLAVTLTPPNSPGVSINNVARVSASQLDDDLLNNRDVERTQLVCAESVIQLSASVYTVSESTANATITATRTGGACGVATVQFDTAGSSAIAGVDFTDVTGTLTWADGDLANKTFSIPITNDGLDEIDERLLVSLSSARGASLGSRSGARLSITDDDAAPRVNFTQSAQSVPEAPNLATITVRLGGLSGRDVTVPLSFAGTATNGSDYFPTASVITIPAGQFESSADIEIAGDSSTEPNETIIVGMGAVAGATVGSISTDTITIVDDDAATPPTVSFDIATASLDEATASTVRLQLSAASTQSVTVPYTVSGAAKITTDYTLSLPSPIVFSPGEVEKLIVLTPVNDTKDESDENAVLTLGTPTNAMLGTTIVHTRTIIDNDP